MLDSSASLRVPRCSRSLLFRSPPAGLLVGADAEERLPDDLVRQHRVRGVNAAEPRIAEQPLEAGAPEDPEPAAEIPRAIHDSPRPLDGVVLGGEQLGDPHRAVVDAAGPVLRDTV